MTEPHHADPIEENIDSHPVKVAIGIGIGAIALVIGIILLAQYAIGAYGSRSLKNDPLMKPEAVEQRIAPDAKVAVDPNAPAPAAAPAAPPQNVAAAAPAAMPPAAPAAASASSSSGGAGKATFDKVCSACHSTGAAGAPKLGDKAAWGPRIAQGKDALYHSALNGKNAMPPKGGMPTLPDADVKAAVDYMAAAAK